MPHRCIALAAAAAVVLAAAAAPVRAQDMPKSLACAFKTGSTIAYSKSVFRSSPVKPLSFDIAEIDLEGQKAALVTGKGSGPLRVIRALNANHFLEVVNEGFLNITTVYDLDPRRKAYPAVHSRHLGIFGEPVVAQYHGFCTTK
jgi:hypothetical protein